MDIEIFWTKFAEDELHRVFKFYLRKAGYTIAKSLADGIYQKPFDLQRHPELGQI